MAEEKIEDGPRTAAAVEKVAPAGVGRLRIRSALLLALLLFTALLFVATGFLTRGYQRVQDQLAQQWYQRGQAALANHQPAAAVTDFRTALSYSRDDPRFRLRLAQALLADGRIDEAVAHLHSLWQDEPGNGQINLLLAQIAAQRQEIQDALRYFHIAIYGAWDQQPEAHRLQARIALVEFLLSDRQDIQAQAELTSLAAALPATDVPLRTQVADLFERTNDHARALAQYRLVLRLDPKNQTALAGAGRAAFETAQYRQAQRYLETAVRENPQDTQSAHLLDSSNLVLRLDPYQRGLTQSERQRRGIAVFNQAGQRLQSCAAATGQTLATAPAGIPASGGTLETLYQRWNALRPKMNPRVLRRDPDSLETALNLAFAIEQDTSRQCGPPAGADLAISLIARPGEGSAP